MNDLVGGKIVQIRVNTMQNAQFAISSTSGRQHAAVSTEHFRACMSWCHTSMAVDSCETSSLALGSEALRAQAAAPLDASTMYSAMHGVGLHYLPKFQVLKSIRYQGVLPGHTYAEI